MWTLKHDQNKRLATLITLWVSHFDSVDPQFHVKRYNTLILYTMWPHDQDRGPHIAVGIFKQVFNLKMWCHLWKTFYFICITFPATSPTTPWTPRTPSPGWTPPPMPLLTSTTARRDGTPPGTERSRPSRLITSKSGLFKSTKFVSKIENHFLFGLLFEIIW